MHKELIKQIRSHYSQVPVPGIPEGMRPGDRSRDIIERNNAIHFQNEAHGFLLRRLSALKSGCCNRSKMTPDEVWQEFGAFMELRKRRTVKIVMEGSSNDLEVI